MSDLAPFDLTELTTPAQIFLASAPVVPIFTSTAEFHPDTLQGSLNIPVLSNTLQSAYALFTEDSESAQAT